MANVYSWGVALDNGCEPRQYSYKDTPLGTFSAKLDFKIWAKDSMAVVCYFTEVESGTKFQISVFRLKDKTYRLKNDEMDFTECPVDEKYQLTVEKNGKGNPFLKECELISGSE